MHGLVVLDKPAGVTSHDALAPVKAAAGRLARVGHAGTLDPFATGVLLALLGDAARLFEYAKALEKTYEATIRFGEETSTLDPEGTVVRRADPGAAPPAGLAETLARFVGEIEQTPPPHSALKIGGQRAYLLARAGERPAMAPRRVRIHSLDLEALEWPEVRLVVRCGSGTYLRSLARDLGESLGLPASLVALRRRAIGPFEAEGALRPAAVTPPLLRARLLPPVSITRAAGLPEIRLSAKALRLFLGGGFVRWDSPPRECAVLGPTGEALAGIGVPEPPNHLRPRTVLRSAAAARPIVSVSKQENAMTASPSPRPDVAAVRARFPAFESDLVFFENAGGSQVPAEVADAVRAYMRESYVQLGAGYPLSDRATETVDRAHELVRILLGGGPGDVAILGASCTQLVRMLAGAFAPTIRPGDEIVIMEAGHEANVGPWERLAQHGATIRTWRVDPDAGTSTLEALDEVLSDRTRVVAMSQTSNLLGDVIDVAAVAARTKAVGARLVVDGVAYAPHRAPEFAAAGADFYVYSVYKVYGPHLGGLVAKREALAELEGPNHFFVPRDAIPAKWEPGGVSHEACAGIVALGLYLNFLAGRPEESPLAPETIRAAYAHMEALERPLKDALVPWLRDRKEIRLLGPAGTGPERVPTVSFVHRTKSSREIAAALHRAGFAVRAGHMYSWRLMAPLGLDPADGVVRVSAVHYNTPEEAARLLAALAPHL